MNLPDPHRSDKEMLNLGWNPAQLLELARQRARVLIDVGWNVARIHPAWAPLRGEAPPEPQETPAPKIPAAGSAYSLASYLALQADAGDDDAALLASAIDDNEAEAGDETSDAHTAGPHSCEEKRGSRATRIAEQSEQRRLARLVARQQRREEGI